MKNKNRVSHVQQTIGQVAEHPANQMSDEEARFRIQASRRFIFDMARKATGEKHPFGTMVRATN